MAIEEKNRYRTHRFATRAMSVFRVKFNVEFTRQVVNFSIESCSSGNSCPLIGYLGEVFSVEYDSSAKMAFVKCALNIHVDVNETEPSFF